MKNIQIFLILFSGIIIIFSYFQQTIALDCPDHPVLYFARCFNGNCNDGFMVRYDFTGNMCEVRPVVIDKVEDLQGKFKCGSKLLGIPIENGIYKLKFPFICSHLCEPSSNLVNDDNNIVKSCLSKLKLTKVSENNSKESLQIYLSIWKKKEIDALSQIRRRNLMYVKSIIFLGALLLLLPWILIIVSPRLRTKINKIIFVWILIQFLGCFILFVTSGSPWTPWHPISTVIQTAIIVAIIIEVSYFFIKVILKKTKEKMIYEKNHTSYH